MKVIGGLYLDYCKHPDWITSTIQHAIFPKVISKSKKGVLEFSYQGDDYIVQISTKEEEKSTWIWIYTNSEELSDYGYEDSRGEFIKLTHTIGLIFLLRNLICQCEGINFIECEAFNPDDFSRLSSRIKERLTSNSQLKRSYSTIFDINKHVKESELRLDSVEIIELTKIKAQPCNFYFYTSVNKEKTIDEFLLKVGIELGWDNTFLFETLFLPFTYDEMMSRFRTHWAKNSIQELGIERDKSLKINLVFKEDELSFLIQTTNDYFYIEENFWWS